MRKDEELLHYNNITAFATATDLIAISLVSTLNEHCINVPNDLSVIGFNNLEICKFCIPPLTTIKQPKAKMGELAMNLLLDMIEGKKNLNKNILLDVEIIERKSIKKI